MNAPLSNVKAIVVAAARMIEERLRSSRGLRRLSRDALVALAKRSTEVRAFVRIRTRRIV